MSDSDDLFARKGIEARAFEGVRVLFFFRLLFVVLLFVLCLRTPCANVMCGLRV